MVTGDSSRTPITLHPFAESPKRKWRLNSTVYPHLPKEERELRPKDVENRKQAKITYEGTHQKVLGPGARKLLGTSLDRKGPRHKL